MDYAEREYKLSKIFCGYELCTLWNREAHVFEPTPLDRIKAHSIYEQALSASNFSENPDDDDMINQLIHLGNWDKERQDLLDELPTKLENLKVEYYNNYLLFKRREQIKEGLSRLKRKYSELYNDRQKYNLYTREGYAASEKNKYLICMGTFWPDGKKVWTKELFDNEDDAVIEKLVSQYYNERVHDDDTRELSKGEPWRSIWSASKVEGSVFGVPSARLTSLQKSLIMWSKIYDSIRESSECPPDEVVDDDDMIDGWLILQSRKHNDERTNRITGKNVEGKHGGAGETFVIVENPADIARVESLNVGDARIRKMQRLAALEQSGGKLAEQYMPDSQNTLRQMATQQLLQKMKGK